MADPKLTGSPVITADKVEGTAVYDRRGNRIGNIEDLVLDKINGKVLYAVMSFGGFLGIGEKHHPLPWSALTYDTKLEGYVVDVDKERLEKAPSYESDRQVDWTADFGRRINTYWNVPSEWP
ncbi:MAG: PRC-barrel domain-containing protein [Gemmatimonas sp.]